MQTEMEQLVAIALVISPIISALLQILKQYTYLNNRLLPIAGLILGVVVSVLYAITFKHQDQLLIYAFSGLLSGLGSMGVYQLVKPKGGN